MDPNETLRKIREQVELVLHFGDQAHASALAQTAIEGERLAELVASLDGWLSKGGFVPAAWRADGGF